MGAWGPGSFENDTALDYLHSLAEAPEGEGRDDEPGKVAFIIGPLATVQSASTDIDDMRDGDDDEEGGYLEADLACDAIAAAEVIAAIHGKPHASFKASSANDEDPHGAIAKWITTRGAKDKQLSSHEVRELAISAITKIRDGGELHELWNETEDDDASAWKAAMNDLIARLR
ncbi:MAG TPA: DUF4259 domain-containing protein [Phycisphaerales bacterium]|nr:DUF4259 domain-containing protein [Phycisphaerales bacterium]